MQSYDVFHLGLSTFLSKTLTPTCKFTCMNIEHTSSQPHVKLIITYMQDDYVMEMCRFGAGELHVVAAFMGGMAAQVTRTGRM